MEDMEKVYQQHARTVYKFLLTKTRDEHLAEELTQETFYQAVKSVGRFDGSCKVSVWLCQIAKHLWYQHLRKRKREGPEELPEAPGPSKKRGSWISSGRSTPCRSSSGRWSTSGPSGASASGRLAT